MADSTSTDFTHRASDAIRQDAARILLETKSVLFNAREPFTFTSGKRSPVYVDCRRLISFPNERAKLMDYASDLLSEAVSTDEIDYVAGGETAGIPYAAFIAERLNKPMLYVRKKPKGFGRMAQIEGCMDDEGKKVVLVEDLQTDGGSKKVFVDALRDAGAVVTHSLVIFHYGIFDLSAENMAKMKLHLHALTDWWAVLKFAKKMNYFDRETIETVETFLNDPVTWQAEHAE